MQASTRSIRPRTVSRSRRPLVLAVAALLSGVLVAGCGGTSGSPIAAKNGGATNTRAAKGGSTPGPGRIRQSGLNFSKCMRADGVPNFPDLGSSGMRIAASGQTISVNGVSLNAPAFQAAREKCQHYLGAHTHASPSQQARQRARDLTFANCMRSHGVPNYPDPQVVSSQAGNHAVFLRGVNPYSPAFQTAAKACGGFNPKG